MKRVVFFGALSLGVLFLAAGCRRAPELETRTFPLEHLGPGEAQSLVLPYVFTDREGMPGKLSAAASAITVRETPDNLDKIGRVLKEYDKARPDVRLHFRLIEADGYKTSDPRIAEVEAQLRKIFQFGGYRLMGEAYVAATDESNVRQGLRGPDDPYAVSAEIHWVHPRVIRLQDVWLWHGSHDVLIQTTVNVRPGQTLVLGTSPGTATGSSTGTLLLAVTADSISS